MDRLRIALARSQTPLRIAGGAVSPGERGLITRAGLTRLEEELEHLRTVERERVAARMSEARESPGDQSDNLELLEAQHDYGLLEARIADLEYLAGNAEVVETEHSDSAQLGSTVVVRDDEGKETYTLVGPAEADPRQGLISIASPVGSGLLGTRAGDQADVETPLGPRRLKVIKVS